MNYDNTDIYDLLRSKGISEIIRHYKVIKRNDYNSRVTLLNNYRGLNKKKYYYEDSISQDIDDYNNSCILNPLYLTNRYKDESLIKKCNHMKDILNGKHYESLDELKNNLQETYDNAVNQFGNDIYMNNLESSERSSINSCNDSFNNSSENNLYIRLAPSKDMKNELLERLYEANSLDETPKETDGIPVYNDHIIYSNRKYDQIKQILNEE